MEDLLQGENYNNNDNNNDDGKYNNDNTYYNHNKNRTAALERFHEALDRYASNANNIYPNKYHLVEMNPSIARLPRSYLDRWMNTMPGIFRNGDGDGDSDGNGANKQQAPPPRLPLYIATYRVTHQNNCFADDHSFQIKHGGDYDAFQKREKYRYRRHTDFVGLALLDEHLDVVADIVVTVGNGIFEKKYEDFRIHNLRSGGDEQEQLYLSTTHLIVPIRLSLILPKSTTNGAGGDGDGDTNDYTNDGYNNHENFKEIPPAFPSSQQQQQQLSFRVWHRKETSCIAIFKQGYRNPKNILYFDEYGATNTNANSGTTSATTGSLFFPNKNPNVVYPVNLKQPCPKEMEYRNPSYFAGSADAKATAVVGKNGDGNIPVPYPDASFKTIEDKLFPSLPFFWGDRGSACCTRVERHKIPIRNELKTSSAMIAHLEAIRNGNGNTNSSSNDNNNNNNHLLVAIVHPKTKPRAPSSVGGHTYFSRFIAFLPHEPYTIVARSGKFCLGFPEPKEMIQTTTTTAEQGKQQQHFMGTPLYYDYFRESTPFTFGEQPINCPTIHFVLGMTDKAKPYSANANENADGTTNDGDSTDSDSDSDSVIISYSIQDCLSRFIEVKKSDIIDMF
mmetsp:Transcript_17996/g.37410  ORF Transcript_17996/g.37410 Transcript_17996/m.37410 type:complete len:618 (-) Transcript_17996:69-1922(-)